MRACRPGQHLVSDFPVLSAGPTPSTSLETWTLALQEGGSLLGKWTWDEFQALPQTTVAVDIHCVTKWSKLDTEWQGVSVDTLLDGGGASEPPAPYVMAHCDGGYTTNLPVEDLHRRQGVGRLRATTASRSRPSTAGRRGCSCRTSTSGRAPSGCAACASSTTTSRASGRRTATTCTAIPGASSATAATELPQPAAAPAVAGGRGERGRPRDAAGR